MRKITLLKILLFMMCIYMTYLVIDTSMKSSLLTLKINEPWFTTALIDFYFNTVILAAWVIYKERTVRSRTLWILGFIFTGSIATTLYVLVQLYKLKPGEPFYHVLIPKINEEA